MSSELGRICILSNDYPSKGRPVYVFVEQLVKALVDLGEEICVIAPQSVTKSLLRNIPVRPRKQEYITDEGKRYMVYRPYILTFGNYSRRLYQLVNGINRWSIERYIKNFSPGILYAHFWNNAIRIMDYAMKEQIPVFVACGEGDGAMEEMMKTLSVREKRILGHVVKGVISVSTKNKHKCLDYELISEQDIIVLPNAVNSRLFHPIRKNTGLRTELGVADDDFLVLFVGGFIRRKGSGILAKAVNNLGDPHIKVVFIGALMPGDEDDPQCEGVVFKGLVPHDKLPEYYACADVFVLPTQSEGCCNAIVEALAIGLPVISSNGSFNDDILNEDNSIRVDPTNVYEIASAIVTLRDNSLFRSKLKDGALRTAHGLTIERRAEKILQFIKKRNYVLCEK